MERPPSYGFKYHQGTKAKGIGFEEEVSPTLTCDWHVPTVLYVPAEVSAYGG